MQDKSRQYIFSLLQLATVAVFLGRAWQHLYWDAPYRTLLWDEQLMKGLVATIWGLNWKAYITSPETDEWIQHCIRWSGVFYLICAVVAAFAHRLRGTILKLLPLGSVLLIFLAALYTKEKFYAVGQFLEYSLQFATPILFYHFLRQPTITPRWIWAARILTALTFTCHGLYAVNFYPRPGLFVEMTISILGVSETGAIHFLNIAGVLDFIISAALLCLPTRWLKPFLLYTILWGLATSLARIWAHFYWDYAGEALLQWLHETIFRFPHFIVPMVIYVFYYGGLRKEEKKP